MSESAMAVSQIPYPGVLDGRAKHVPGSTGILLPGMEARILRPDGSDTELNEPGELWIRSGATALGYWDNEKATKETFVDGWLRTGDVFSADGDGVLYFQDRAKVCFERPKKDHFSFIHLQDTLKISGMQVSPTEIEQTLLVHPDKLIIDAAVAGVSGGRTSDEKIPRAWIVLSDSGRKKGESATIKALEAWTRKNLSKYKQLRGGIEVVNEVCSF